MLVQALAAYADTYLQDQLSDLAFEEKPVPWALTLYDDGTFAGLRPRIDQKQRGKKTVDVARPLKVPKSPVNRNTGLYPLLGCDGVQYVLGPGPWTEDGKEENHRQRHEAFKALIGEAAAATQSAALQACAAFYDNADEVAKACDEAASQKVAGSVLMTLSVVAKDPAASDPGGPVVSDADVRQYWREHYTQATKARVKGGGEGMCLVTGRVGPIAPTHDKIKGAASLGGQPAGVALMSFDKSAFRSYGWDRNANSPVCPEAASAYVLAFNDLMRQGEHRQGASGDKLVRTRMDIGGVGFLFWTRKPSDDDFVALFMDADPSQVAALLDSPRTGLMPETLDSNDFYLLAVSGNGGRLLVRQWFSDPLPRVRANIRAYFEDLRIADVFQGGKPSAPPMLWQLILSTAPPRMKSDHPSLADRTVALLQRAVGGRPLGYAVLAAALARLRVATGSDRLNPVRMGLVRMSLNDILRHHHQGETLMGENLDADHAHPAYVCGRLLAVYEALQYAAQGDVNVTVVDRYYGLASTQPAVAFRSIVDLGLKHLKKLRRDRRGLAVTLEREITVLMELLDQSGARFPKALSIEDQGRFAIGFHHQKAETRRRILESKEKNGTQTAEAETAAASH